MTAVIRPAARRPPARARAARAAPRLPMSGVAWMLAAEGVSSVVGFAALVVLARRLGPSAFARLEYAAAVAAWLLVLVRGGVDVVVYREAARRPRLVAPLTDLLLGLRLAAAVLGYGVALGLAALVGPERGGIVAVSGLLLFVAVAVTDVGPRATGRLGWVAVAQTLRVLTYLAAVVLLVVRPPDALRAAGCLVGAEALATAVLWVVHARRYGPARPRWRGRASLVLARRGTVAGLTRFGRVTLYGLDLLALGWWVGPELGPYAAARRIVFAVLALGLVVPATLGPALGRAWSFGPLAARRSIGRAAGGLWALGLPAALGLILTADRLMPWLFGAGYRDGGPWLMLVAARLPLLLSGSFAQAALVACRRESWCLRLAAMQMVLGVVIVPPAAFFAGPWGVGWASLAVEAVGAVGGWVLLARLGVAERWGLPPVAAVAGCLALAVGCTIAESAPLVATCLAGALAYAAGWGAVACVTTRRGRSREADA
jgi:O-antigen/teichoic acid export membrane protein